MGDSSATYHQVSAGASYSLSKRTNVYLIGGYTHGSGQNGAGDAEAVVGSYDIDSGKSSQAIVIAGVRHAF
jgi:predicted porin